MNELTNAAPGNGSEAQLPVPSTDPPDEHDLRTALVLYGERLIDAAGFKAFCGRDIDALGEMLADPAESAAIEKLRLQMINSGRLYRIRTAREAYMSLDEIVEILRNPDTSATNKIEAHRLLARGGGVEKPPTANEPARQFVINIVRHGREPITITAPVRAPSPSEPEVA